MPTYSDSGALPPLMDAMAAASAHQADECIRLLDEAEAQLHRTVHKARPDIARARDAATRHAFVEVWQFSYAATCGLTYAYPPDASVCSPLPGPDPLGPSPVCSCGQQLHHDVRFCHRCGAPNAPEQTHADDADA